jgi:MraZ protein
MNATLKEVYTDIFEHSFDEKGRVAVPCEWRTEAHEKRLHVIRSGDGCLKVYPASFLSEQREKLKDASISDPRRKQLEIAAQFIQAAECDQQGRIVVKNDNRKHAGLKKEAVLIGCLDHFEIWDRKKWKDRQKDAGNFEEVMSQIGL